MAFDSSTYSGYGQSMRDFANSVGKFSERIAQRREEEKQLKALKGAYRPFAEDLGYMSPEEFDNADAREITRRIQAKHVKEGLDQYRRQKELDDAAKRWFDEVGRQGQQQVPPSLQIQPPSVSAPPASMPRTAEGSFDVGPMSINPMSYGAGSGGNAKLSLDDLGVPPSVIARYGEGPTMKLPAFTPDKPIDDATLFDVRNPNSPIYAGSGLGTPPADIRDAIQLLQSRGRSASLPQDPASDPSFAAAVRQYAQPAPGMMDRINAAIASNPRALASPQVINFIENMTRMEAIRAQQQRAQAAAMPDVPLGDYVGQTRPVDGVGTMVFNGKSWELVRPDKTQTEEEGLELGKVVVLEDGTTLVGTGRNRAPHVLPREKDRAKALTEAQSNALMFSNRLAQNNATIEEIEKGGFNPASWMGAAESKAPNIMRGEAAQKYDAAKRNWMAAVLRKESGAAISKDEYKQADEQYFPQWGDSPAVAAQKAELRRTVERDMRRAAGQISETLPGQVAAPAPSQSGTNAPAPIPAQLPRYKSAEEALKSGHKPGDLILLYDPSRAGYRQFRL